MNNAWTECQQRYANLKKYDYDGSEYLHMETVSREEVTFCLNAPAIICYHAPARVSPVRPTVCPFVRPCVRPSARPTIRPTDRPMRPSV